MALGPNHITRNHAELANQAEKIVDAAIAKSFDTRVTISTSLLPITHEIWREHLQQKYRAAGWKVADWTSDQRDGDFIDLSL